MSATNTEPPADLTVEFDVYDPSLTIPEDKMQARAAELAEIGPLVYSKSHGGHWIVTHYDEVRAVLKDYETFSSHPNNLVDAGQGKFIPLELDPPEHTAYRAVLQPLFNPSRMKEVEDDIRAIVNTLIDGFIEKGECDFVPEFAHELPAQVFLALMGWPLSDAPLLSQCTQDALMGKPGGTEEESAQVRQEAAMKMFGYFMQIVTERRGKEVVEGGDVTTAVINTPLELDGEERLLTDEELCRLLFLVLIAGLHTTKGALAWGLMHFAQAPEMRQQVLDNPDKLKEAIEEVLRMEAAVAPGRSCRKDTVLGGVELKQGDQLLLMLCAANRDADHFADPDELKIDRNPNDHVSFGGGRHQCIGRHLARRELRIAFEEIHRRMPDYALAADKPAMFHPSQTRGVITMPITFTPGPKEG